MGERVVRSIIGCNEIDGEWYDVKMGCGMGVCGSWICLNATNEISLENAWWRVEGISGDEWKKNRYNNIKIDEAIRVGWIMGDDMMGIINRRIEKEYIRNLEIVGYVMNVRKTMRGDRGIFCEEVFERRRKKRKRRMERNKK